MALATPYRGKVVWDACSKMNGASAFILDFSIRSRFVGYHDTLEVSEKLVGWARKMREDFGVSLDRLRLVDLQQSTNPPAFQIPDNDSGYDLAQDA